MVILAMSNKIGRWSFSAADFVGFKGQINTAYDGGKLLAYPEVEGAVKQGFAPVHLPDGVTVTSLLARGIKASGGSFSLTLYRQKIDVAVYGVYESMAGVGDPNVPDDSISHSIIDNTVYAYYFWLSLKATVSPPLDTVLYGGYIEYEYDKVGH